MLEHIVTRKQRESPGDGATTWTAQYYGEAVALLRATQRAHSSAPHEEVTMDLGYLEEARELIDVTADATTHDEAMVSAQIAIACALVAQTELQTAQTELLATHVGLLAELIERLDALTVSMASGEKAFQTYQARDPD